MSRAILVLALARTFHRQPTQEELKDFLIALRDYGGERIYVPQADGLPPEVAERVFQSRADGLSIRAIAKAEKLSKSQVHRALSQNPDLFWDKTA